MDRSHEDVAAAAARRAAAVPQLADEAQAAVGDVRRVVDDLRPPALDQLGLVPAIRQQAARFDGSLAVTVEASGDLADLPAAVEVATSASPPRR